MKKLPFHLWNRGKVWYFRKQGEKTFHSSGIPTTVTEKRARDQIYRLMGEGLDSRDTFGEFAADFFSDRCMWLKRKGSKISPTVAHQRRSQLIKHIMPQYKHRRLVDLTKTEIANWLTTLERSYQTKRHIMQTMRVILEEAKDSRLIKENPLTGKIDIGERAVKQRDIFTLADYKKLFPEDREKLLKVWEHRKYAALFAVLAYTGIRSGEARALCWRHYVPGEVISVLKIEQAVKRDGSIGTTKTRIKIPQWLPPEAEELLFWWRDSSPWIESDDLIFFGQDATIPLDVSTVSKMLLPAMKRAKIETEGRNLVVHSLRHTVVSRQLQKLPREMVRELVGHKTAQMTDNYDQRAFEDRLTKLKEKRQLIEKIWQ